MNLYEKKYNEAQKWIESIYSELSHEQQMEAEAFFPELQESKDERTRKEIISFLQLPHKQFVGERKQEKWIAWLEKQGEPVEINPTEFDTRLQSLIGKFDSLPKEELIGSLSFWLNVVQNDGTYKSDEKQGEQKSIWHNEDEEPQRGSLILLIMQSGTPIVAKIIEPNHTFNHGERWAYIDDLLKKQGEQKEMLCDKCKKEQPSHSCQDITALGRCAVEHEQKSDDKVEAKFHEGDWVVDSQGLTHQIERVVENVTTHTFGYDIVGGGYFNNDNESVHLWTIQDAKDGDVLCVKYGNDEMPFIFTEKQDDVAYCALNSFGEFVLSIAEWLLKISVLPATKEQRDLLFTKMKEAGFEWDSEKKELKKISQRMVSAEAKEALYDKPAWSEEDEKMLHNIENCVHQCVIVIGTVNKVRYIDWLKSLKQRIGWKPSEEQIECLYDAINHYQTNGYPASKLNELYEQMSKIYKL